MTEKNALLIKSDFTQIVESGTNDIKQLFQTLRTILRWVEIMLNDKNGKVRTIGFEMQELSYTVESKIIEGVK